MNKNLREGFPKNPAKLSTFGVLPPPLFHPGKINNIHNLFLATFSDPPPPLALIHPYREKKKSV